MYQSKKMAAAEVLFNSVIGFLMGVASQLLIFPVMSISVTISENIILTLYFTVVSIIRTYIIRRIFNKF